MLTGDICKPQEYRTHRCARDAEVGVGVAAVQPNTVKRTELGGGGEARGGALHDEVVLLETRQ